MSNAKQEITSEERLKSLLKAMNELNPHGLSEQAILLLESFISQELARTRQEAIEKEKRKL